MGILEHSLLRSIFLYCVVPWFVLRLTLYVLFGVSISYINPLRLRIVGIKFRDVVEIEYLQASVFEKKIICGGLRLPLAKVAEKEADKSARTSGGGFKMPPMVADHFNLVVWLLSNLSIRFERLDYAQSQLSFRILNFNFLRNSDEENTFTLSIFMSRFMWQEDVVCEDALYIIKTKINRENLKNGGRLIGSTLLDFKVGDFNIPQKIFTNRKGTEGKTESPQREIKETDSIGDVNYNMACGLESIQMLSDKIRNALEPIDEVSISIDKLIVKNVPITTHPDLKGLNQYLSFNVSAANFSLNAFRYEEQMPCFKINYLEGDSPIRFNMNLSGFNVSMNMIECCKAQSLRILKILEVPNISFFGSTNLLTQEFDFCSSQDLQNAVCNLKGHVSSPNLDIDVDHLSFLKCFRKNIEVFTGALKTQEERSGDSSSTKGCSVLRYIQTIVPLMGFKFTIEDIKVVVSDKDEFIVHKLSALMLDYKTNRYIGQDFQKKDTVFYEVDFILEVLSLSSQHINKKMNYKRRIILLDSIRIHNDIKLVPDVLLSTQVDVDTLELNLSDLPTMLMINKVYRKVDSRMLNVEETFFMHYYEKFSAKLRDAEYQCASIGNCLRPKKELPSDFLFKELPSSLDYLKIDVRDVMITLGARSLFMPPCIFSDIESQSADDFVNEELRKYYHKTDKIQVVLFGNKTQWHNRIETGRTTMTKSAQLSCHQHQDVELDDISTSDATEVNHTWNFNVLVNNMSSSVITETIDNKDELSTRKVSKLSVLSLKVFPDSDSFEGRDAKNIVVQIDNKRLKSVLSLGNLFIIISGIHTLKQVFTLDVCSHKRQSLAKKHFLAVSLKRRRGFFKSVQWDELKSLVRLNFSSEVITQILVLPSGLPTRLDIVSTFISIKNLNEVCLSGQNFRVSVESPMRKNFWVRMIIILKYAVNINIRELKNQVNSSFENFEALDSAISLENESWHFNIPHDFEMYKIFDNIPTIFKSLKQMIHSFNDPSKKLIINPSPVKTPTFPKIGLKSKRFVFSIDDDPFEADLNMIFQIGLQEQRSRLDKLKEMDNLTAAELLKTNGSKLNKSRSAEEIKKCDFLATINAVKGKFRLPRRRTNLQKDMPLSDGKQDSNLPNSSEPMESFVNADTEAAYQRLLENFSTSWISRVQQYRYKEKKVFEKNFNFLWGNIDFSRLPPDINQRVLPLNTNPFLTNLVIEGINIKLFHPSCGIDRIPDFISKIGKNVPKNFEYSIMIPMYVDAKFKEIRLHLRDYPLPLLYIPSLTHAQNQAEPDIHFHGDLIISEDMIQSEKEIRHIFVPLVPSALENSDTYYSLQVLRTITSLKFYTNVQLDINSRDPTQVTWGGGYQPAIQQTMQCLDYFSKPPLDPSPKIGFWDKIRYLFHARLRVSWKNCGRFEISLKGGKSPYKIGAGSAGFIVGFSGNVELNCNENDDPHKLMSCTAEKVHFSIPNYFAKPLLVWSQPSDQKVFIPGQNDANLEQYTSFYYLLDFEDSRKQNADIERMRSHYIEKTGIKLSGGVTLNVGMVFERLVPGKRERVLSSAPHYDVRLCNPISLKDKEKHDSYAGFRSEFIHLAFSILSSSDSAYNAMQLSPAGLRSFKDWWKSFAGTFPVRRGNLFGDQSISPKFGEHLFTISYFADVSPLFITYITHSIDAHALKKGSFESADFAGLKSKASQFVMDLHQRKEVLLEYQEELEKTKRVMRLKFLEAQISVFGIDLRTVDATLNRLRYQEEKSESKFDIFDNDMSWFDITDFKETNYLDVNNYIPTIAIKPLLHSPQFIYIKRASYGDKFQVDPKDYKRIEPFQNKLSHKCVIGKPIALPFEELNKRSEILNEFKTKTETALKKSGERVKQIELEKALKITSCAIENIENLVKDMKTLEKKRFDKSDESMFNYPIMNVMYDTAQQNLKFENRYYICNMLLKWNEKSRDVIYKFLHNFNLSNDLMDLSAQKCMHFFNNIVHQRVTGNEGQRDGNNNPCMQNRLDNLLNNANDEDVNNILLDIFEKNIMDLGFELDHAVQLKHIVHFITPQIQLITEQDPDSCIIVTAPSIKLKTLSFCNNDRECDYNEDAFMKRTGIHLTNANLFRFHKDDYKDYLEVFFDVSSYGQNRQHEWPPWLGMELCFEPDNLSSEALIKDFSSVLFYERISQFSRVYKIIEGKLQNSVTGYLPKIILSSDSRSYLSIYNIVTNLLIFITPEDAELQKRIERLTIGLDTEDTAKMESTITELHSSLKRLQRVDEQFSFKRQILDDADALDLANIRNEIANHLLRLYIFMKVFSSNKSWADNADHSLMWNFYLREIIMHMLNDKGQPFVDVAIAKLHFERSETSTGFNSNFLTVHMAQAFDLQREAVYQDILGPFFGKRSKEETHEEKLLVSIKWTMEKPIGGIKVVKYVETDLADLNLCLEEHSIRKILTWFLPDEISPQETEDDGSQDDSRSISDFDPERIDAYMNLSLEDGSDVQEMIQRSTDYVIIENLVLNKFRVCTSFKGTGALRLINVTNFIFSFPKLVYENQTVRIIDLLLELKKIIIKDMIKHTPKFIGAKVRNHPVQKKPTPSSPLKQLTRYDSYMETRELKE